MNTDPEYIICRPDMEEEVLKLLNNTIPIKETIMPESRKCEHHCHVAKKYLYYSSPGYSAWIPLRSITFIDELDFRFRVVYSGGSLCIEKERLLDGEYEKILENLIKALDNL